MKERIDMYRQTWQHSQHDTDRLNRHVGAPKLGFLRQVVVAETDDEALAITRDAHDGWYRSITKLWHDHDDHSVDGILAWETATQHETILSGSPRRVCDQLDRLVSTSGCNYVICAFAQVYVLGYHRYLSGLDHDPLASRYGIVTGLLPISWPTFDYDCFIMHLDVAGISLNTRRTRVALPATRGVETSNTSSPSATTCSLV